MGVGSGPRWPTGCLGLGVWDIVGGLALNGL